MSRVTKNQLKNKEEIGAFETYGYAGLPPGSDAVLALRGVGNNATAEQKVVRALALNKINEPAAQSITLNELAHANEFINLLDHTARTRVIENSELIYRGQGNVNKLSVEALEITLEAIRQRQDARQD